jgi:hypothetical protein
LKIKLNASFIEYDWIIQYFQNDWDHEYHQIWTYEACLRLTIFWCMFV